MSASCSTRRNCAASPPTPVATAGSSSRSPCVTTSVPPPTCTRCHGPSRRCRTSRRARSTGRPSSSTTRTPRHDRAVAAKRPSPAAQELQCLRMGSERRIQNAPAGGRDRLGRDFWFYFSGQAVSQLGGSFTTFALPLLVFKLTHSATNLALTTAAEFVPYLLFGLLLGAVVDRFDRKRLMLGSDIAQALVIAVIPVLAIGGSLHVADIYAVVFVQSTLGIVFNCGEFAAIPSLVGARVAFVPVPDLLFVDAGSFLVSSGCLVLIRRSFNAAAPAGRPAGSAIRALFADVREGLAYVWSSPVLRSISIMMALINLVATTADSQLVLFARRALHATNSEIGFLYAAGAVGIVA